MMKNLRLKLKVYIQKHTAARQEKMRQEFLPEAQEIIERAPSPMGHFVIFAITLIVIFFIVWSIMGTMDEVATARGKVVTVSGVQNIQARDAGVIKEICVTEGEHVMAGQPIVVLDTTISNLTLQNTKDGMELLTLENTLLSDLLEGKDISGMLLEEKDLDRLQMINYVLAIQRKHESQKQELDSTIRQAELQIEIEDEILEKMKANLVFLEQQREAMEGLLEYGNSEEWNAEKMELAIEYKEEELLSYQKLYELGALSKAEVEQTELELEQLKKDYEKQNGLVAYEDVENSLRLVELDNQLLSSQRDCKNQESAVMVAEQKYQQAVKNLNTLEAEYTMMLTGLLVENEDKINAQESDYEMQNIYAKQQEILAPADGVIKTLEVNTQGGVLTMAQPVATLVPDDDQIIVEVMVQNQDIGYIQTGQVVALKLDTYNFQKYGKLEGTVTQISPDAVLDEQRGWVYIVKVQIDDEEFRKKNPDAEIGIGLECTAEIKIGKRRIIDFFLEPIVEYFDGSLKIS